jgi:hypothetical protein
MGSKHSLQANADALLHLLRSFLDDVRRDLVQATIDVFLAVLVEDTPCAASGHSLDGGEVVVLGPGHDCTIC